MKVSYNPTISFKENLIEKYNRNDEHIISPYSKKSEPDVYEQEMNSNQQPIEKTDKRLDYIKKQGMSLEEALNDDDWSKTYYPKGNFVHIRQIGVYDGKEYEINADGSVIQVCTWSKPKIIKSANDELATYVRNLKNGKSPEKIELEKEYTEDKPKKSLWCKMKEGIANIWKFFSVTGTMVYATGKGLLEGAITGAIVYAGTTIVRGSKAIIKNEKTLKEIIKNPITTAGKTGKVLGAITAVAVLTGNIIAGRLHANQNSAVIEHKMDVKHVN